MTIAFHSASEEITISPSTFEFTAQNWRVGDLLTITAVDDNYDENSDTAIITHTITSTDADYGNEFVFVPIDDVTVTIEDDDTRGYNFDNSPLTMEEGEAENIGISLQSAPTFPLTITVRSPAPDDVLLFAAGKPPGQSVDLIFDDTNWNVAAGLPGSSFR